MSYEFKVEDVEYVRHGDTPQLARLYRPQGRGPFPIMVELHGGAWCRQDRLADKLIHESLARSGVVVASLDFRQPPAAPYPASFQDIHYGIRWLKARATELGSRPDMVGSMGNSSGGHQAMLLGMRPFDARYGALPLLRWRPRQRVNVPESTPRRLPSGAASQLDPSHRSSRHFPDRLRDSRKGLDGPLRAF